MTVLPDPPVFAGTPLAQITPFTYREGATLMYIVERLKRWSVELGPEIQVIIDEALDELTEHVDDAKNFWESKFDEFMADIIAQLEGLNDQAMANLIRNELSETRKALETFFVLNNALVINVEDFGAKNDGNSANPTDNTAAFANALAKAKATGRPLYVPGGSFWVSGMLTAHDNLTVYNFGTIRKRLNSESTALFNLPSVRGQGYGAGVSNVKFIGGTYRGDFANNVGLTLLSAHHSQNLTIKDAVFTECVINNHLVDLGGCRNVKFSNVDFVGFAGTRIYGEAIQLDNSTRIGATVPDDLSTYDGLATRDVYLENVRSLPIKIGAIEYPCPNPIGSHWGVTGKYFENIKIRDLYVESPISDTSSASRGVLHFFSVRGLDIDGLTINNTKGVIVAGVRTFNMTTACALSAVNVVGNADAVREDISDNPQTSDRIRITRSKFIGFKNSSTLENIISLRGSETKNAQDIFVDDVEFIDSAYTPRGNVGALQISIGDAKNVHVSNVRSNMSRRVVFLYRCPGAVVRNIFPTDAAKTVAPVHVQISPAATIDGVFAENIADAVYVEACPGVEVSRVKVVGGTSGNVVRVAGSAGGIVKGVSTLSLSGAGMAVFVSDESTNVVVTDSLASGVETPYQISGTSSGTVTATALTI